MSARTIAQFGGECAVSTPHSAASDAAMKMFRDGGNAVDAALAAAAVLAVVYPNQCSLGGDLIALVGTPDGRVHAVNASGRAPLELDLATVRAGNTSMPATGPFPVTVPGVVSGWEALSVRWGRRQMSDALAEAEIAAREGVEVSPGLARGLARDAAKVAADTGLRGVFQQDGELLPLGATLRQPRLAESIAALRAQGATAMYAGVLGECLVEELRGRGSAISMDDLAGHRVDVQDGIGATYAGLEYVSTGGNSQGVFFLAGLRALEWLRADGFDLDPLGDTAGHVAGVLARAALDRDALLGDAEDPAAVAAEMLSDRHVESMLSRVVPAHAIRPPAAYGDTAGVTTADGDGLWVSLLQSVFQGFGAGILEPRSGIVLHNRGASFTLRQDAPNRLAAGRRPPHTLMPVITRENGHVTGCAAVMGGRAQPQIQAQLILALTQGASVAEAVSRPRWVLGTSELDSPAREVRSVLLEEDVPDRAARSISASGLAVERLGRLDDEVGHAHVIRASAGKGSGHVFEAATDPRADGSALTGDPR